MHIHTQTHTTCDKGNIICSKLNLMPLHSCQLVKIQIFSNLSTTSPVVIPRRLVKWRPRKICMTIIAIKMNDVHNMHAGLLSVCRSEALVLMLHTCNHPGMLFALIISRCHRIVAIISVHPDYSRLLLAGEANSADLHTHVEDVALNAPQNVRKLLGSPVYSPEPSPICAVTRTPRFNTVVQLRSLESP